MKNEAVKIIRPILKSQENDYRLKTLASAVIYAVIILITLRLLIAGLKKSQ